MLVASAKSSSGIFSWGSGLRVGRRGDRAGSDFAKA
jgi:hypothetical protein